MSGTKFAHIDLTKELRLRRWARRNYVPAELRSNKWHPIVLDEMKHKEKELLQQEDQQFVTPAYVPLAPSVFHHLHEPHATPSKPNFIDLPAESPYEGVEYSP